MHIDIIIPTLNEAKRLPKVLDFLFSQKENEKLTIIVADADQSSDNTKALCLDHDVFYFKSKATCRSIQINEGAAKGSGDVLFFLHADVIPPDNFYDSIKKALDKGKEAGLFSYKFDSPNVMLNLNAYFTKYDSWFAGGGDQCLFITRARFDQLNGFNSKCVIMEDFDFFDRLKANKISYQIIDKPALVSARKYDHRSYLKVNLANLITFIKFRLGTDNQMLKHSYQRWLDID